MRLPRLLAPLRTGPLRRLWAGQSVAQLAAEVHVVVVAWLALELTGSGLALGSVLVVGMVPRAALVLVGGVTADRADHRRVLVVGNAARTVVATALAVATMTGGLRVWHLVAAALVLGAVSAFVAPAYLTAVPRELPPDEVRAGNALVRGTAEAVGTVGPALGGLAVGAVGTGVTLWCTAACYAVATLAITPLALGRRASPPDASGRGDRSARGPRRSVAADLRDGAAVVRADPVLLRVLAMIAAAGLALAGPVTVGVPWLAREELGLDAAGLGLLLSAWTAGSLAGVAAAGTTRRSPGPRALVGVAAVLAGALVLLGTAPALPHGTAIGATALLAMGAAAGACNVLLVTWLQQRTPPATLGRLMGFAELAEVVVAPASYLLAGMVLDVAPTALMIGAAAVLLAGAVPLALPTRVRPRPTASAASGSPPR